MWRRGFRAAARPRAADRSPPRRLPRRHRQRWWSTPRGPVPSAGTGPGSSPRSTWPTRRGRITVSASTCRSSPAASSRCTGRSAGVPAAASRVRPTGEPSRSFCRRSDWASSSAERRAATSGCSASSTVAWPGYQGRPVAASVATRTVCRPNQARSRRSSTAAVTVGLGRAVADQLDELGQRHSSGVGLQHQQGVSTAR